MPLHWSGGLTCDTDRVEQVAKEKHIQAAHERQNRARELGGPKRWPGGPACGADEAAAARPPFFVDSDIWRGELRKHQVRGVCACLRVAADA